MEIIKCRAPKIPPILVNNVFDLNCAEKAKLLTKRDFFSKQCTPIMNSSVLPTFNFLTDKIIDVSIQNEEIISLIRNLNPSKGLLLCDNSVVLLLKIILQNILRTSTYPDMWKLANVTPIFKNTNKQYIKNYRQISLLPIYGKLFKNIIFNNLYSYLKVNNLTTKNQEILQLTRYYILVMRLSRILDPWKCVQFFLTFLRPLIKSCTKG